MEGAAAEGDRLALARLLASLALAFEENEPYQLSIYEACLLMSLPESDLLVDSLRSR